MENRINDSKTWGSSLEGQKKLLAIAIGEMGTDVSNKFCRLAQLIADTVRNEEFAKNEQMQKQVMGLLNGLYFYTSLMLHYRSNIKEEYFRMLRHLLTYSKMSWNDYNKYLFDNTEDYIKRSFKEDVRKKLEDVLKDWKNSAKHDWYCYCTQYNVFGNINLPEEETTNNELKNGCPSIITECERIVYNQKVYGKYISRLKDYMVKEDPGDKLFEDCFCQSDMIYYKSIGGNPVDVDCVKIDPPVGLSDEFGVVYQLFDSDRYGKIKEFNDKLVSDKALYKRVITLYRTLYDAVSNDLSQIKNKKIRNEYLIRLYGCALAYAFHYYEIGNKEVDTNKIEIFTRLLKVLPQFYPEQIVLNLCHPNLFPAYNGEINFIEKIKNEMEKLGIEYGTYYWNLKLFRNLSPSDIPLMLTQHWGKDTSILYKTLNEIFGLHALGLTQQMIDDVYQKTAELIANHAKKLKDEDKQICVASILDYLIAQQGK